MFWVGGSIGSGWNCGHAGREQEGQDLVLVLDPIPFLGSLAPVPFCLDLCH